MIVKVENSIIFFIGFNLLYDEVMRYIASIGYVIFLDYFVKGIL